MLSSPDRRRLLQGAYATTMWACWGPHLKAAESEPLAAPAIAALLKERLGYEGVGLLAAQVQGDAVSVSAEGLRSAAGTDRLDPGALFEIGSITKTFTALLLADAVVRKQLTLDGAVEEALPGIRLRDSQGAPIRWIDLATHRSGLPRLPTNMAPRDPNDPYADYGEARLLDYLRNFEPELPRDTRWAYSNLGFGLLGHALARAAGTPYAALLKTRVLLPLGLRSALLQAPGTAPAGLAEGHDAKGRPAPHWHFDALAGAGALLMNGADLARYAQAALGAIDTPLREAFTLALQEHAAGPNPATTIGLAWLRAPLNGRTVLNHDGATFGFSSSLWLDPERRRASAVLANALVEVKDLALHLLDPAVPAKDFSLTRQTAVTLDPDQLMPLVGTYALNADFKLSVRLREGKLFAQATGQAAFELFANSPLRFFAKVTPLTIEFDPPPRPAGLTLMQSGQTLRFLREP